MGEGIIIKKSPTTYDIQDLNQFAKDLTEKTRLHKSESDQYQQEFIKILEQLQLIFENLEKAVKINQRSRITLPFTIFITLTKIISDYEVPDYEIEELYMIQNWIRDLKRTSDTREKINKMILDCMDFYQMQWERCFSFVQKAYNRERRYLIYSGDEIMTDALAKVVGLADNYYGKIIDNNQDENQKKERRVKEWNSPQS